MLRNIDIYPADLGRYIRNVTAVEEGDFKKTVMQ